MEFILDFHMTRVPFVDLGLGCHMDIAEFASARRVLEYRVRERLTPTYLHTMIANVTSGTRYLESCRPFLSTVGVAHG